MNIQKKIQLLLVLLSVLLFSGCIRSLDTNGLTMKIEESELNNFSQQFPINQDFVFAFIQLEKPHIFIKKGTNRLAASINMSFSTIFIPTSTGTFSITGSPFFDKETSSIYLKDIQIEELKLTNVNIDKNVVATLIENSKPIIDDVFNRIPIYKIDKSSFKGSFINDIKIENSELLVTFGL